MSSIFGIFRCPKPEPVEPVPESLSSFGTYPFPEFDYPIFGEYFDEIEQNERIRRCGGVAYDVSKTGLLEPVENPLLEDEPKDEYLLEERHKLLADIREMSAWGTHGIDDNPWDDKLRPFPKQFCYEDLDLTDAEIMGVLTKRVIAAGLSYIDRTPETLSEFALCKCVLSNKGLRDIAKIQDYKYLQYINFAHNSLVDVSALDGLSYLMYLDVSHNEIVELLNFSAPKFLTFVNYSHNVISKIPDLSTFWSIKTLNLSNNYIKVIEGIQKLEFLEVLDLSHNRIRFIENLDHMRIMNLSLNNNQIDCFDCGRNSGFNTMKYLSYIRLAHNRINTLRLFKDCVFLQSIDMEDNDICDLLEISYLRNSNVLISLNLKKNQIQKNKYYEVVCLETMRALRYLDEHSVETIKKVHAEEKFNPCIEYQAAKDYSELFPMSHISKLPYLGVNLLPANRSPRPLIIVVGLLGSKHDIIVKEFADYYSQNVTRLTTYTSRPKDMHESINDYFFITKENFDNYLEQGEMLMMYEEFEHFYGLTQDEYGRGSEETDKVMILHSNLNAALVLRMRGFRPAIVLAIPKTKEVHREWIEEDYELCFYDKKLPKEAIQVKRRRKMMPNVDFYFNTDPNNTAVTEKRIENVESMSSPRLRPMEFTELEFDDEHFQNNIISTSTTFSHLTSLNVPPSGELSKIEIVSVPNSGNAQIHSSTTIKEHLSEVSVDTSSLGDTSEHTNLTSYVESTVIQPILERRSSAILSPNSSEEVIKTIHYENEPEAKSTMIKEIFQSSQSLITTGSKTSDYADIYALHSMPDMENIVYERRHELPMYEIDAEDMAPSTPQGPVVPPELIEQFYLNLFEEREKYIVFHRNHPGFFADIIFTDEFDDSIKRLKHVARTTFSSLKIAAPVEVEVKDKAYNKFTDYKKKMFEDDINRFMRKGVNCPNED